MLMIGISFSTEINKGFNDDYKIQPLILKEQIQEEQFAPRTMDLMIIPIVIALLIILLVVWFKDHKNLMIKIPKIKKRLNIIQLFKSLHERIENIEGYEIMEIKDKIFGLKNHPKIKQFHHKNLNPTLMKEVNRTRDLFIKQYEKEFTGKFIALLMIVTVVGMSIFALTNANPVNYQPTVKTVKIAIQSTEQFAPQPIFSMWAFFLALIIIAIACFLKLKKDNIK